jgi:hypothetical protein
MAICRSCGAEIFWLRLAPTDKNPNPRVNPIDAVPHPEGNLVIDRRRELFRFASGNEKELQKYHGKKLYISHFETCPNADRHRTKAAVEKPRDEPLFEQ